MQVNGDDVMTVNNNIVTIMNLIKDEVCLQVHSLWSVPSTGLHWCLMRPGLYTCPNSFPGGLQQLHAYVFLSIM